MQFEEGQEKQKKWQEEGDKPCSHDVLEKEYILGSNTGDRVCITCGLSASPEYFRKLREQNK